MNKAMKNTLIVGGVLTLLVFLAALGSIHEESERSRLLYSTYNTKPAGLKAFYLLLEETGFPVERWRKPSDSTNLRDTSIVWISASPVTSYRPSERRQIVSLVQQGATAVFFYGPMLDTLLTDFGVTVSDGYRDSIAVRQQATHNNHLADSLMRGSDTAVGLQLMPGARVLYGSADGHAVLERRFGMGSIVIFHTPEYVTNRHLARCDNAAAAVHLLQWDAEGSPRFFSRVLVDEFHQGFEDFRSSLDLMDTWIMKAGLLMALGLVIVWSYGRGKRLGRAVPLVPAPVRSSTRYVDSIAGVYAHAGAQRIILQTWYRWLMHGWRQKYHTTLPRKLAAILAARHALHEAETLRLLENIPRRLQEAARAASSADAGQARALDRQEMSIYFSKLESIQQTILSHQRESTHES